MSHLTLPDVDILLEGKGDGEESLFGEKSFFFFFLLSTIILSLPRLGDFFQPPKWTPVEVYSFELSNISAGDK